MTNSRTMYDSRSSSRERNVSLTEKDNPKNAYYGQRPGSSDGGPGRRLKGKNMSSNRITTIPGKDNKGRPNVLADVGEDSRRNARTPIPIIVDAQKDSLERRWNELCEEKKQIEGDLAKYSKAAFTARQVQIRKENYGVCKTDSITTWMGEKAKMEQERQLLVARKVTIEQQMLQMKPRLKTLRQEDDWLEKHSHLELLRSIVFELREIKELLKRK